MARTTNEIYNSMLANLQADPTLSTKATSTSSTAIYKLFLFIIAASIAVVENLFDVLKLELDSKALTLVPGSKKWYHQQCLSFQYGDDLEWIDNQFKYAVEDQSKQIVKLASVSESGGTVLVKVSKETSGTPTPFTAGELTSFNAYLSQIKFAGTYISTSSLSADLVRLYINIVFNPLVMNADGSLISDGSYPIVAALDSYFANIDYGGSLNLTKIIDACQSVQGVVDAYYYGDQVTAKSANESTYSACGQNHTAVAGYFDINQYNLNFIANVV